MLPPNVKQQWDENTPWVQGLLIAYNQIREYERQEEVSSQWPQ